jgi:hypothetical protein
MGRGWLLIAVVLATFGNAEMPTQRQSKLPPLPRNPYAGPYDVKGLGLGTEATVVVAFASDRCPECRNAIPFYKRLLALPRMDGKTRRLIIVATDGLWPVKDVLDPQKLEPNRLTSGPYPGRTLPGVTKTPAVMLLDPRGKTVGIWEGALSSAQQEAIVAAINKLTPPKGRQP